MCRLLAISASCARAGVSDHDSFESSVRAVAARTVVGDEYRDERVDRHVCPTLKKDRVVGEHGHPQKAQRRCGTWLDLPRMSCKLRVSGGVDDIGDVLWANRDSTIRIASFL